MSSLLSDAEALGRSVDEPELFGVVFERHQIAVRRYVTRRVGTGPGEDIASEVFSRAFRSRARCQADNGALPWLLGVANHVIADHRRAEHRRLRAMQRLAASTPEHVEHDDRLLGADLVRALRRLSDADRDTLLLVVWGELSLEEAGTALEVAVGTVKSRIARARRQLSDALSPISPASSPNRPVPQSFDA